MENFKEWNWKEETSPIWLKLSEESFYIVNHWKENAYKDVLDYQ